MRFSERSGKDFTYLALSGGGVRRRVPASVVTPEVIAEVARDHRKGRRLLIMTTDLDAPRPVIWDMGAM